MEDSHRHHADLQEHRDFIRKITKDEDNKGGRAIGRVSMALNLDHAPTTWKDLGVDDPCHPDAVRAIHRFFGEKGFDDKKALARAGERLGKRAG